MAYRPYHQDSLSLSLARSPAPQARSQKSSIDMSYAPVLRSPVFSARVVTTEPDRPWRIQIIKRDGLLRKVLRRVAEDFRDLWTLITKGQPVDNDPHMAYRFMAELAKSPEQNMAEIDAWEAEMFAKSGAWWFDPERYSDTPYDWPKRKVESYHGLRQDHVYADSGHEGIRPCAVYGMKNYALQQKAHAQSALQQAHYDQVAMMQYGIAQSSAVSLAKLMAIR